MLCMAVFSFDVMVLVAFSMRIAISVFMMMVPMWHSKPLFLGGIHF